MNDDSDLIDVCWLPMSAAAAAQLILEFERMQTDATAADCCLIGCGSHFEHEFVAAIVVTTYIFFK